MLKSSIILIGPLPPPRHGQSLCFNFLIENLKKEYHKPQIINSSTYGNKALNSIVCFTRLLYYILVNKKIDYVYLSGSRTPLGIIKELPVYLLKNIKKYKLIFHSHGYELTSNSSFKNSFVKRVLKQADKVIVLNETMKSHYNSLGNIVEIVPNFYHTDFEVDVKLIAKKKQVVYYSNIMMSKGVLDFLDFSELFLQKHNNWEVVIAGVPLGDDYLSQKNIETNFQRKLHFIKTKYPNRIRYLGGITGKDRIKLLANSSIFALPTYYRTEAIPLSIIEAMRMGNIILTTKHNLLPTLIKKENGFLVDIKSPKQIFMSVDKILKSKTKMEQIMRNNIEHTIKTYSPQTHINKVIEALKF